MSRAEPTRQSRWAAISLLFVATLLACPVQALAGQLSLSWVETSVDELGFSIERRPGTAGAFAEVGVTGPDITTYTDTGLADGTTYCYRVRAFNATAYSAYSNVACGATAAGPSLAVLKMGAGEGTVTSVPAGITCGPSCSATFSSGSQVTLTATADAGSVFSGWSGSGCSGTGPCTVTLTSATTIIATFALPLQTFTLTVAKSTTGSGTVTSAPAGIDCGATCSGSYASGTAVTLTATPAAGSAFTGWSGACAGIGPCTITMSAAAAVTANFDQLRAASTLTITKSGAGRGMVISLPGWNICWNTCAARYPSGATVILIAIPDAASVFKGWSGACRGTGLCWAQVTGPLSTTATFGKRFDN